MSLKRSLSKFWQTSSGIVISQLLTIAFIPILSRTYAQELFGQFGFFLSATVLISGCASWKLQDAISTVKSLATSKSLTKISLCAGATSILALSPLVLIATNIFFSSTELGLFILLSVASIVVANIGMQNLIRKNKFPLYSIVIFFLTGLVPLLQLALNSSPLNGLVAGAAISHFIAGIAAIIFTSDQIFPLKLTISKRDRACFRIFKSYTHFALPNFFLATFRIRLLYFLLPTYATASFLGIYSQTDRLLGAPTNLLATSLRPLATNALLQRKIPLGQLLERYLTIQWFSLTPVLALVFYSATDIVSIILGKDWMASAGIIPAMALPAFLMATTQWLDRFYDFTRTHKSVLRLEILFLAIMAAVFLWIKNQDHGLALVMIFSLAMTLYYIFWLISLFKALKFPLLRLFKTLFASILIFGATLFAMEFYTLSFLSAALLAIGLSSSIFLGIFKFQTKSFLSEQAS